MHHHDQGEQVRHNENTAMDPTSNVGFLATLSSLFRGQGRGASATDRKGTSVTRHAKATSAFTHRRGTIGAILAIALVASLAFAPSAFAGKFIDRVLAGSADFGESEGLFFIPRGVAVNHAGKADGTTDPLGASTDGYVYVADERNQRIQVFSPDGTFRFMWGRGVESGGDGYEVCDSSEVPCTSSTFDSTGLGATGDDEAGEFSRPQGVAINQQSGDVYVHDRANSRIQQFAADGTFIRAWGWDVISPGGPGNVAVNQVQTVTQEGAGGGTFTLQVPNNLTGVQPPAVNEHQTLTVIATGGTFRLRYNGDNTAPIAFDAAAATVDSALEALPQIGAGNVSVTGSAGGPWDIEFTGALANTDVGFISNPDFFNPNLTGTPKSVTIVQGEVTDPIAFDASAAAVDSALEALALIGAGNVSVTGPAGGPWDVEFTGSFATIDLPQRLAASATGLTAASPTVVPAVGVSVTTPGGGFEVCTSNCKSGTSGGRGGQFTTASSGSGMDVVPAGLPNTGNVVVADPGNRRLQEFESDGDFVRAWGWDVIQPGGTGEQHGPVFDEQQRISFSASFGPVTGGTYTLTFDGQETGPIQFSAPPSGAGSVQEALESLTNVGVGDVSVAGSPGGPYAVEFGGALGGTDVPEMTGDGSGLQASGISPSVSIVTVAKGGPTPSFEICTVSAECKSAIGSGPPPTIGHNAVEAEGAFDEGEPRHLAVDATGTVYAGDSAATSDEKFPGRVQRFDSTAATASELLRPSIDMTAVTQTSGAPGTLAVDPTNGNLIADHGTSVVELADPSGSPAVVDRHVKDIGFAINGMALDGSGDDLYFSTNTQVFAADDDGAPPALAFIGNATDVEAHSATLSGCVDPAGTSTLPVSYRFQYSTDGIEWVDVGAPVDLGTAPIDCDDPGNRLEASATGLAANTLHRFRILTARGFGNADVPSPEGTFVTDSITPTVSTSRPSGHTDSSALLAGSVNPNGSATTYRFEWGKTTGYGKVAPFPDRTAGSGGIAVDVIQPIGGLEPASTYHYRLCAENAFGVSCGGDQAFSTRSPFAGFADRAYEQVTPPGRLRDSGGIGVLGKFNAIAATAADGGAIAYGANGLIPEADYGTEALNSVHEVISRRSAENWTSDVAGPRPHAVSSISVLPVLNFLDSESNRAVVTTNSGWLGDAEPKGGSYLLDYEAGTRSLLFESAPLTQAATADLSHVVLSSNEPLTPQGGETTNFKVYESTAGSLRLVSVDAAGNRLPGNSEVGGPRERKADSDAISADGRHIFFSNPVGSNASLVYRRSDGATTTLMSPSKRTPVDPMGPRAKVYEDASRDGDRVFFTSSEQLTDDANTGPARKGVDLYRHEASSDTLIDVSAEANTVDGARVEGILGASEDGDRVYYVALGQPIAGAGTEGKRNLYVWHDDGSAGGSNRFIATLGDGHDDMRSFRDAVGNSVPSDSTLKRSYVSADGATAMFQSARSLTGAATGGHTQVYVYEADAGSPGGSLSCASCRPDGTPSQGGAKVNAPTPPGQQFGGGIAVDGSPGRALSEDGSRALFHTTDALLEADRNDARDVYVWEEGRLSLISTGTSNVDSYFIGISASGDDVFFLTDQPLVGQDYGDGYDIYDARVGGGLAAQSPPPPGEPCVGDGCKPATEPPPGFQPPASREEQAQGNYVSPFEVGRLGARQRRALARSGRVRLRVRANQPGRIAVRAIKGKRTLGAGSKLLLRPGATAVALKLRPLARRMLAERGRLSFRLEIRFAGEKKKIGMRLRAPGKKRGGAK
jgi:hypothetical protein